MIGDRVGRFFTGLMLLTNTVSAEIGGTRSLVDSSQTISKNLLSPAGYIIENPGYYTFGEDIDFNASLNATAITIASSSVTLDMNNRTLMQTGGQSGVTGIKIDNTGLHDITIKNGTLFGFSGYGLYHTISATDTGAYNVTVDHLDITGMTSGATNAIRLVGTSDNEKKIHDWSFSNCIMTSNLGENLCLLSNCNNIFLKNCKINENGIPGFSILYGINSNNLELKDCELSNNRCAYVVSLEASAGCSFEGCRCINNFSSSTLWCMYLSTCVGSVVRNCIINKNSGSVVYGINLSAGTGNRVESCEILSIDATATAYGIYAGQSEIASVISDSRVQNSTSSDGNSYGIYLDTLSNCLVSNCLELGSTSSFASGYGIYVDSKASKVTLNETTAHLNKSWGIFNDSPSTLIYNCVAGGNGTSLSNFSGAYPAVMGESTQNFAQGEYGYGLDYVDGKIFIYKSAIQKSSPGLTISLPGDYVLAESIDFAPSGSSNVAAITIASSYVTLDMNNNALYQVDSTANVDGIRVNNDIHDIDIIKGKLSGFSRYGIVNDASSSGNGAYNITVNQIDINGMPSGYSLYLVSRNVGGADIHDWFFSDCILTENDVVDVFNMQYCNNIFMNNCMLNGNGGNSTTAIVYANNCSTIMMQNCEVCQNKCTSGIYLNTSNGCSLWRCIVNNNYSSTSLDNIYILGCSGSILNDCMVARNLASTTISGIYLSNGFGNRVESCQVNNNSGVTSAIGVYLNDNHGTQVHNSTVLYMAADNPAGNANSYGLDINRDYHFIENCEVMSITASSTGGTAAGYGVYLTGNADANVLYKCKSVLNKTEGFHNTTLANRNAVTGCVAALNSTNYSGGSLAGVTIARIGSASAVTVYDEDNRTIS